VKRIIKKNKTLADTFAAFDQRLHGPGDANNNVEYYDGNLRMKDKNGAVLEEKSRRKIT